MTLSLLIYLLTTLSLLAVWIWSRRRDRQEILRLAADVAASRSALHEFMQETEATFAVFSRMVHKVEPSNRKRVAAQVAPTDDASRKADTVAVVPDPVAAVTGASCKKMQVLSLADKGMAVAEIASCLTIPRGEIDLILNLNGRTAAC